MVPIPPPTHPASLNAPGKRQDLELLEGMLVWEGNLASLVNKSYKSILCIKQSFMKGRYKGEALLEAQEVFLWCLTSSGTRAWPPLVHLSLPRDLKHLKQDWCCPPWFQLPRARTLQTLLLFPSSCRSREFVGGRSVVGACVKRLVLITQMFPTFLPSSELSHRNEAVLEM